MDVKKIYLREIKCTKYELERLKACKNELVELWNEGQIADAGMTLEEARKKFSAYDMFKPILNLVNELLED